MVWLSVKFLVQCSVEQFTSAIYVNFRSVRTVLDYAVGCDVSTRLRHNCGDND